MINTLFLPELREMLAENNSADLQEFCAALHPARTAEFMEGLESGEAWEVLKYADPVERVEIFSFFEFDMQQAIVETQDLGEIANLIAELPSDDRVDLLAEVDPAVVEALLPLLPTDERRDILRLQAYPEGTAGAVMTSDAAKLSESLTVKEALEEIGRQAEELETIYYLFIVDDTNHLRGLVSARQLISAMGKPETTIRSLMETELITADVLDDQEDVARKVARYDLLAIPVVDDEHRMLGMITHDDVIDVVREEATEDAHRIAAVTPLEESYLKTPLITLSWKRGIWLTILFFAALLTAVALQQYEDRIKEWTWLVFFIPLIISCGGNSGSQSATLIITSMTLGEITLKDWWTVVMRELGIGLILGSFLGMFGYIVAYVLTGSLVDALVMPITLVLVVVSGTLSGSILPLLFHRLGLDPALMSSPFVAGIVDILGILIYMNVALAILS